MKITKAVITAAGYGTRFLPATKNVPKELLPIINKPSIHYLVENCIEAGVKDIIIVTKYGNHAVEDYFDSKPSLEQYLIEKGKIEEAEKIKEIYSSANFIYVRQNASLPYGNASPLYSVRSLIGSEPFLYTWGDDIFLGNPFLELVQAYEKDPADIMLNGTYVTKDEILSLGMISMKENSNIVEKIIEKPKQEQATSNIASVSPYILHKEIFDYLDPENVPEGKEFILQEAIDKIVQKGNVKAVISDAKWLKTGDPLSYLKATVEVALQRDDLKDDFLKYLKARIQI